jgi:hypothetical protein
MLAARYSFMRAQSAAALLVIDRGDPNPSEVKAFH